MDKLILKDKFQRIGKYHSRSWKYEKAIKYVFVYGDYAIEAGCYTHYLENDFNNPVKSVIELSTSYGCPFRCKYCASSTIKSFSLLSPQIVFEIFVYIYKDAKMWGKDNIEVSFMGIGDTYYTYEVILSVIPLIISKRDIIKFNVSSCYWTEAHIKELEKYHNYIKTIQLTYVSSKNTIIKGVIPGIPIDYYDIRETLHLLEGSEFNKWRINYIMIKSVNDSEEEFYRFLDIIKDYKDSITVRISQMNITNASVQNCLSPPGIEDMELLDNILKKNNIRSYLFYSYQNDSMNCGQLITEQRK